MQKKRNKSKKKVNTTIILHPPYSIILRVESVISRQTQNERMSILQEKCSFVTEEMFVSLESLSRIHPFDSPNLIQHMIDNSEQWNNFHSNPKNKAVQLPGPYINMQVEEVEKNVQMKATNAREEAEEQLEKQDQPSKSVAKGSTIKSKQTKAARSVIAIYI